MHVHLPKPLHGWREFIGEVGIIVIGVVIALALEQVVEIAHWRHKVDQTMDILRNDIRGYDGNALEEIGVNPCVDQQLQALEARLTARGAYRPAPLYHDALSAFTVRAPDRIWASSVWKGILAEGVASHIDWDRREDLEYLYAEADQMNALNADSERLVWRLRSLAQPIDPDPSARAGLIAEIEELRGHRQLMTFISRNMIRQSASFGLPTRQDVASALSDSGTATFCRAHHLPLVRY